MEVALHKGKHGSCFEIYVGMVYHVHEIVAAKAHYHVRCYEEFRKMPAREDKTYCAWRPDQTWNYFTCDLLIRAVGGTSLSIEPSSYFNATTLRT